MLDLPKGQLGQLTLTLDRAPLAPTVITLQNSNPAALQVPEQVTVAAGQLSTVLSLVSLQQGSAQITASLSNGSGGSSLQATVNVVAPQIVAITVTPPSAALGAGQSLQLQAQGTYTDASARYITLDPATLWKSEGSGTAAVKATGLVTGQQPGQTRIIAEQTPAALQGQGAPQVVQGSAAVVVNEAGALSLTASRTSLSVGETIPVVLALPYPINQSVTVNLTATTGMLVPTSLTLAAGETSRSFTAQATAVGSPVLSASPASTNTSFEPAQLAFSITAAVPTGPVISNVAPNAGAPGTPVTLIGSGFSATPGGNTVVFTGNAPAVVQSASNTQLVVTVPATAQTGPISVTTTAGTGTSPIFTVQRDQAFDLQSSPAQLSVMQGSQASAVIQLASSGVRPFEGLANLSITGLPAGITARFEPAQISAQQSGQLILSASDNAALGSSTLTLQASATLDGLGRVTSFEYDTQGNQTAMTNALGFRTETAFEPVRNKPTSLTQYLLGVPSQQGGLQLSYTPVSQSMFIGAPCHVQTPTLIDGSRARLRTSNRPARLSDCMCVLPEHTVLIGLADSHLAMREHAIESQRDQPTTRIRQMRLQQHQLPRHPCRLASGPTAYAGSLDASGGVGRSRGSARTPANQPPPRCNQQRANGMRPHQPTGLGHRVCHDLHRLPIDSWTVDLWCADGCEPGRGMRRCGFNPDVSHGLC